MGCASSTPMIATAGSDILKAASHVAQDAAKSAEDAMQDVTQSLNKTIDSVNETVGTTVAGFTTDIGNAIKEKSDDAKNTLMETFHLNGNKTDENTHDVANSINQTMEQQAAIVSSMVTSDSQHALKDMLDDTASEHSTPVNDIDSLKTSTPEPEIEQALANREEDGPATPKPTLTELAELTGNMKQTLTKTEKLVEKAEEHALSALTQGRPGTTEWEKYADSLWQRKQKLSQQRMQRSSVQNTIWPKRPNSSCLSDNYEGYATPTARVKSFRSQAYRRKLANSHLMRNWQREWLSRALVVPPHASNMFYPYSKLHKEHNFDLNTNRVRFNVPHTQKYAMPNEKYKYMPAASFSSHSDSEAQEYIDMLAESRLPNYRRHSTRALPFDVTLPKMRSSLKDMNIRRTAKSNDKSTTAKRNNAAKKTIRFLQEPTNAIRPRTTSPTFDENIDNINYFARRPAVLNVYPETSDMEQSFIPIVPQSRNKAKLAELPSILKRTPSLSTLSSSSDCVVIRPIDTLPRSSRFTRQHKTPYALNNKKYLRSSLPALTLTEMNNNYVYDISVSDRKVHRNAELQKSQAISDISNNNRVYQDLNEHCASDAKNHDRCVICFKKFSIND